LLTTCGCGAEIESAAPASGARCETGSGGIFAPPVSYDVMAPSQVVAGDLNGDGKLDLVVLERSIDGLAVLMNEGDGTFAPAVSYPTTGDPTSVAVADLNGDGKLDLVVTGGLGEAGTHVLVTVLLNAGDGTFIVSSSPAAKVGDAHDLTSIAAADLDGDGKADLAVVDGVCYVGVLAGKGGGAFAPAVFYPLPMADPKMVLADMNGDGRIDIVAVTGDGDDPATGTASVLLNVGDGVFAPAVTQATGSSEACVAAGDLDGDGKPDLALAGDSSPGTLSVMRALGGGAFASPVQKAASPEPYQTVLVGDVDGDGRLDVVGFTYDAGHALGTVLLNRGGGAFVPAPSFAAGDFVGSAAMGDLNGDGRPDLAVAGTDDAVRVLINKGCGP
jgi:hypothetical protein